MRNEKSRWRRGSILLLLLLLFAAPAFSAQDQQINQKLAALEKVRGKFSFIVLGDNRSGDEVYKKLAGLAMERKPAFIVNTGDQISTPGDRKEWATFWEMSKVVTVPYFLTVGNHDIHHLVSGSQEVYREQVDLPGNELYYSFKAGNALFMILDSYHTDEEKKITGEQYAWLEKTLATSKERYTFIFLHHPLYLEKGKGKHVGSSLDAYPAERDRLQALFVKHKVTMVFAGHNHLYMRKVVDGIPHVITGGGGAPLYANEQDGGFYHFIAVTVNNDTVSAEVVDSNGTVRDKF